MFFTGEEMRKNVSRDYCVSILLVLAVLAQIGLILVNCIWTSDQINHTMYYMNYIIGFLIIVNLAVKGLSKHFLAIAFFGCYMLFLMAQKPFKPEYNVYLTFVRLELDTMQYFVFSMILFIGLAVTYYVYMHFSGKSDYAAEMSPAIPTVDYQGMRVILFVMLLVTFPCALYMQG